MEGTSSSNPFVQLLPGITSKPPMVPADPFKNLKDLDSEALELFKKAGVTAEMITSTIKHDVSISYDRFNLYSEIERALEHWFVGPAMDLYSNVATTYNPIHNATVWITSSQETYETELNSLLDRIGIEEKIYDWANAVASYGDLFAKLNGIPGLGITSVEDGLHPGNIGRLEYDGGLIGFYETAEAGSDSMTSMPKEGSTVIPPWEYVHFRLLGAKKKRPRNTNDPTHVEMRQIHLITGSNTKQATTKYGTSLLINALPAYKRLRLAEDSLLLARLTRGIVKYIWKCKIDMTNAEAASQLIDQYATLITRARAISTDSQNPMYDSKQNSITAIEDIFVPVWGDVNDLTKEEVGGNADIRWIVDVDNLRNQLAFALACSPSLGGAFTKESSGALGSEALSELGIRFARSARRLQRALISGIIRICQVHLAYMGFDPDPNLFEVHMSETSTAEEAQMMKSLQNGFKAFQDFTKTMKSVLGAKYDGLKGWEYFNEKILKMEDLNIMDLIKSPEVLKKEAELKAMQSAEKQLEKPGEGTEKPAFLNKESISIHEQISEAMLEDFKKRQKAKRESLKRQPVFNLDVCSCLPTYLNSSFKKLNEDVQNISSEIQEIKQFVKKFSPINEKDSPNKISWISGRDAAVWFQSYGKATISLKTETDSEESIT